MRRSLATLVALAVVATWAGSGMIGSSGATPVPGAPGCPMFPADSFWHADASNLPVHAQSATYVNSVGTAAKLKADFGAGMWDGGPIGIPYTTVPGTQPRVPVSFYYGDQSDPGPYPLPPDASIEGGPDSDGDRHVLVVDRDVCRLWEVYDAHPQAGGASWDAGSGATWDLRSNAMRPSTWTSADAAGLPILPGLVRYDEVAAGEIDHVIRFTAPRTANAFVWPASHKAATGGASDPPMGSWFRLKPGYDISRFSPANQVILRALKKHGMVLADNGSSWFMSGVPDPRWNDDDLHRLRTVPGSEFEAVDASSLRISSTSYAAAATEGVTNPGFESGLGGWVAGNAGTTLGRTCTVAHTGNCAARLGRTGAAGDAVLDDSPNTLVSSAAGATYAGSAWVKARAGRSVVLRVRELQGSTEVRSSTTVTMATGVWQRVGVTSAPANGGTSLSLEVSVSLTTALFAHVDDLSLRRA